MIDSGVSYTHPDLAPNIWINNDPADGIDNDGNGKVDDTRGWDFVQQDNTPLDFNGHGTHVAGTIGAQGNNGLGVTGVNWDVTIMPIRAGDAYGGLTDAIIASSINYACLNGADIVNGSFGGALSNPAVSNAIKSGACANTLFVFAAGNGDDNGDGKISSRMTTPTTCSRASITAPPRLVVPTQPTSSASRPRKRWHALFVLELRRHRRPSRRAGRRHLERAADVFDPPGVARRLRGHDGRVQLALERAPDHHRRQDLEPEDGGRKSGTFSLADSPTGATTATRRPPSAAWRSSARWDGAAAASGTTCGWPPRTGTSS